MAFAVSSVEDLGTSDATLVTVNTMFQPALVSDFLADICAHALKWATARRRWSGCAKI